MELLAFATEKMEKLEEDSQTVRYEHLFWTTDCSSSIDQAQEEQFLRDMALVDIPHQVAVGWLGGAHK